jgi:diaminohydroxyphosphoribosylaminopyrimidine deaminase/5-amino-6-(5-phosphoribosylamino)uracil reductase
MEILRERGAEVITMPQIVGQVNLASLFADLGRRGLQSVLLESGAELNGEMLRRGFVDRMMVFIAPRIVGGADARGVFGGCGVARMAQSLNLRDLRTARFGDDILIEGEVEACSPD